MKRSAKSVKTDSTVEDLVKRLRRVEGQVRAITTMISEGRDCQEIALQMSAARGALDRAMVKMMAQNLVACLAKESAQSSVEIERLTETFVKMLR